MILFEWVWEREKPAQESKRDGDDIHNKYTYLEINGERKGERE